MIYLKTDDEIQKIKESCILVCKTLAEVASHLRPGISGFKLNEIAEDFIRSNGGIPSFLGYKNFPASLCISKNEVVVHGYPIMKFLKKVMLFPLIVVYIKMDFMGIQLIHL
jgi:methionyl aminopeptidase